MKALSSLMASIALLSPSTAFAQDRSDIRIRIGLGVQSQPAFIGSASNDLKPLVDVSVARGSNEFAFEAPDDSFDVRLISSGKFSMGPVAAVEGSRTASDAGVDIGRVPATLELGIFGQYELSQSFRLRTEVRQGIGGHKGLTASLGADRVWRSGDRFVLSVGPRLLLSNRQYQRTWFGVSSDQAASSGLPRYRPDGGVHAIGATSGLHYQLARGLGLFGYARYDRLIGNAARSPLVRDPGSRNQVSGGIGLTYSLLIKRSSRSGVE